MELKNKIINIIRSEPNVEKAAAQILKSFEETVLIWENTGFDVAALREATKPLYQEIDIMFVGDVKLVTLMQREIKSRTPLLPGKIGPTTVIYTQQTPADFN